MDDKKYKKTNQTPARVSIAPWLSVRNAGKAAAFYKLAFDADEKYRLETPDGLIVELSVGGAIFWVSDGSPDIADITPEMLGGGSIRMILTTSDPDSVFKKALESGATEVFPINEDHGWRLGRLTDPFGLHWEIGHPVNK